MQKINEFPIVFGEGIAGTGKTMCAVYMAIQAVKDRKFDRVTIIRPIVESGESLGFLPGDIREKTDPYFIPIHDSYNYFYEGNVINALYSHGQLRTIPLAYLRGVTLNDFVIIDEAQNMSKAQLLMLLTRIGLYGKMVITGDITQTDIKQEHSGLEIVIDKLQKLRSIGITKFDGEDVVRNPIIAEIIKELS